MNCFGFSEQRYLRLADSCFILPARVDSPWENAALECPSRMRTYLAGRGLRPSPFLLCLLLLLSFSSRALAANVAPAPSLCLAAAGQAMPPLTSPNPQQAEPPVNPPVTQAKTETDRYTLSHERYEKAVAYSRAGYTLYFVSVFFDIGVLLLALWLGIAAKYRDFALRSSENWFVQGLLYIPLLVLTLDVLELPIRAFWHSISLSYQQSVEHWGAWFWDWAKEEIIWVGLFVVLFLLLFWVMGKSPRRWWLYFWMAALPILVFVFYISPWFIEPLFYKFEPLNKHHPELVAKIEEVTRRAGLNIPPDRMFLMHASEKTNELNAYVTGFGASKRVVVWDTTLQKTTPDETLFIFGHEAGHYVLGHIRDGLLFFAGSLFVGLYISYRSLHWALARWGKRWKIYGPRDWASIAVLLLIFQVLMFLSSPITNGFSRIQEHDADIYGLEVIHGIVPDSSEVAAHAFQVLGEVDLSDPNPPAFIRFWLYDHPPVADRLVFAHSYDPWAKGKHPKYIKPLPQESRLRN
jgi:Zn-dependent protease with chaperone function